MCPVSTTALIHAVKHTKHLTILFERIYASDSSIHVVALYLEITTGLPFMEASFGPWGVCAIFCVHWSREPFILHFTVSNRIINYLNPEASERFKEQNQTKTRIKIKICLKTLENTFFILT